MLSIVFTFALITALFEAIVLWKLMSVNTLRKGWVQGLIHFAAFAFNLAIHFGTIVGTMTAVVAALTSFVTVPAVLAVKCFVMRWNNHVGN